MSAILKRCFRCEASKSVDEFYQHPRMADGHLGKCKDCSRADMKATRIANKEEYRRQDRERYHTDPTRRQSIGTSIAQWKARNPDKVRAQRAVSHALRDGKIEKKPCEVCGVTAPVEAHHDDYSQPLAVRWVCRNHHNLIHHPDTGRPF